MAAHQERARKREHCLRLWKTSVYVHHCHYGATLRRAPLKIAFRKVEMSAAALCYGSGSGGSSFTEQHHLSSSALSKAPSLLDCLPACFPPPLSLALAHPTPNEHPRESWRQKLAAISGVRQSQCHHHHHHYHHWRISTLCKHTVQIGAPIYIIISQEGTKQWMVMVINSAVGNTAQEKEKEKGLGQRAQPTDEKR